MAHRGDSGEGERARLAYLNELAREVSRVVRHTLDCVRRLLTTATDEAGAVLVAALRSLSHCLERVFDSFADTTTTAQQHRHLNVGELRRCQRTLSEGLLRCMKGLILQGARMMQEVKRQSIMLLQPGLQSGLEEGECTTTIGSLETEFKDTVHRFVVDLREIIRLQHIIAEGDRGQGFGGGNNSGPCSLPSRHQAAETGAATGASISHRDPTPSELATAAVRTYQPATPDQAPKPEGVWQRAFVGVGETGEVRASQGTPLAHGIVARRLMSLGQRGSREVEHGIDGAAVEVRDRGESGASSQATQPPLTVHPYRKSRIVYGFKVKEGAMKLKVELQQTEEEEEGTAVESDDEYEQTSGASQQKSKADISDEQFVSMMLDFFGEMEQRKAALAKTPPTATRNPRSVASAAATPLQPAAPSSVAPASHAEAELAAGEPAVDVVPPARSPPPAAAAAQEPYDEGKPIKAEPAASPTKQQKADEGGKRRQGSKMREGKWYMCMLS